MLLRDDRPRTIEERLEALLDVGVPHQRRRLGVEHEYAVLEGGTQIDFRGLIHRLGIPGRALHPTNRDLLLMPTGLAVMADGVVAETAAPPTLLGPGGPNDLARWGQWGRQTLEALLPEGLTVFGGSTHISVETRIERPDQLCLWFAQTFAPALMLLMDRADSPGILVRPRPHRFEVGGEFLEGERLTAAATFLAGAVLALEEARDLPPALEVSVEPGRQRFGWYVERSAFGPDLYVEGRRAQLRLRAGGMTTAQSQLQACWETARAAIAGRVSQDELDSVDRIVLGSTPLPAEDPGWDSPRPIATPPRSMFAALAFRRGALDIQPVSATWDYVAFKVESAGRSAVLNIPFEHLDAFRGALEDGRLDSVLPEVIANGGRSPILQAHGQTGRVGVFSSLRASDDLLPRDRVGVGPGPVSTTRPGKIGTPTLPPPNVGPPVSPPPPPLPPAPPPGLPPGRSPVTASRGFPWLWGIGAAVALLLGSGSLFLFAGDEPQAEVSGPTPGSALTPTDAPAQALTETPSTTDAPTAIAVAPPVVGPIVAELVVPVTTYRVEATSPAGLTLTYRWFLEADAGEECGTKSPATDEPVDSAVATWSHANEPPDDCHHLAADHPFNVRVEVSDGVNPPIIRTYRGSNTGAGSVE